MVNMLHHFDFAGSTPKRQGSLLVHRECITIVPLGAKETLRPDAPDRMSAAQYVLNLIIGCGVSLENGDIVVVTSKVVSILEGRTFRHADIVPSMRSIILGKIFGKDPGKVEIVMREGRVAFVVPLFFNLKWIPSLWEKLLKMSVSEDRARATSARYPAVFMVRMHAALFDEAGLDSSNVPAGYVSLLPSDPCRSAETIREELVQRTGRDVAVIITDTISAGTQRFGSADVAVGYAGIDPITRFYGRDDLFGTPKSGGLDIVVDGIASVAGIVMGQNDELVPACVVRGMKYAKSDKPVPVRELAMPTGVILKAIVTTAAVTMVFHLLQILLWPMGYWYPHRKSRTSLGS